MILSIEEFAHRNLKTRADVCIVGASAAGLELACALAGTRRRVVLIDRQPARPDEKSRQLARIRPSGREIAMLPQEGASWSGEWRVPDPAEWAVRPWLGREGAGLVWNDLSVYAESVMKSRKIPAKALTAAAVWSDKPDVSGISVSRAFVETVPSDLRGEGVKAIAAAENVTLVTGGGVVELLPAPGGGAVEFLSIRSLSGLNFRLAADVVVLATGAIDTSRLMLASTRFGGIGPGNIGGHLGRGLMDHLSVGLGTFQPGRKAIAAGLLESKRQGEGRIVPRMVLSEARLGELQIPNHALFLAPTEAAANGIGGMFRGLVGSGGGKYAVTLLIEQVPNPVSAVTLDSERDEIGLPVADVRWELSMADIEGVRRFLDEIQIALGSEWGTLDILEESQADETWSGGGHLRGTVRMAASWKGGVVDPDGVVFGLNNLFVTGSAVVAACGHGDPTLLTLSLARRLARRLAGQSPVIRSGQ